MDGFGHGKWRTYLCDFLDVAHGFETELDLTKSSHGTSVARHGLRTWCLSRRPREGLSRQHGGKL